MPLPEGLCPVGVDSNVVPQILLCFKKKHDKSKHKDKEGAKTEHKKKKKRSKSRELRCGILYVGCDCERRNGLQDQCPRTGCQGSPECMTHPPTCLPSEFAGGKHLIEYFEAIIAARAAFKRKLSEQYGPGKYAKKDEKSKDKEKAELNYDCFPIDKLILAGMPCPICNRPIDKCFGEHVMEMKDNKNKAPFTVDLTSGCLCCPTSCES